MPLISERKAIITDISELAGTTQRDDGDYLKRSNVRGIIST